MRAASIGVLVALTLAAAGCGTAKKAAPANGAKLVPGGTPAFVSISSDLSSDQWKNAQRLLDKFPSHPSIVDALNKSALPNGVTYDRDVKPAVGPEVDLVWLDLKNGGSNVAAITQPKDEKKLKALIDKLNAADTSGSPAVVGKVGDWTAVSDSQAKIDQLANQSSESKLADDSSFKEAMGELPADAIVTAYAKGDAITQALQGGVPGMGLGASPVLPGGQTEYAAAALSAEGSGAKLVAVGKAKADPKTPVEPFASKFVDEVPADALAFVSFRGGTATSQLDQLRSTPGYQQGLQQFKQATGLSLDELVGLFKNEIGLYVRPAAPIPEVTVLLEAPDEKGTLARVDRLLSTLARSSNAPTGTDQESGVPLKTIDFGGVVVRYGAFDGKVVITSGTAAISELKSSGDKLADAKGYKDALSAAGTPDQTTGLIYVDLKRAVPYALGFASAAQTQVPPAIKSYFEPLTSFVLWGSGSGRTQKINEFLQIQ